MVRLYIFLYAFWKNAQFPSTMTQSPFSILKLCVYIQKHSLVNSWIGLDDSNVPGALSWYPSVVTFDGSFPLIPEKSFSVYLTSIFDWALTLIPFPPALGLPLYDELVSSSNLIVKKLLNLYQSPILSVL